ncbi:GNAT family N-acetyltransferase [Kribbella sp. NPDC026611]|uniref:GNAT family N-acetyltransferase n=1 Tax=Kribbella sp. NPDC026611 TaxID=3154911 RepID=UPI003406E15A
MLVREATTADVDAAAITLSRALEDYPMTRACIDPVNYFERLVQYHQLFIGAVALPHGRVWVTDDVTAVAVWTTPATSSDAFAPYRDRFQEISGSRAAIAAEYGQATAIFHPKEPVWFLGLAGVDPDHQRQGLGRAVITPGLAEADAAHSPAFLETQDPANVAFYESLGFTVTAELELPHRGPIHYSMYRAPR